MNQLAPILKRARQALDLTQEDVAKKLGISQRAYAFYEDEDLGRMPRAKRIAELGRVLNIPIKTLMKHYNALLEGEISKEEEEETIEEKQRGTSGTPLTGHATIDDLLAEKDRRIKEAQLWREDIESKYQDAKNEKAALIAIINDYLKSIGANLADTGTNLTQGQTEIKEQLLVNGKALATLIQEQFEKLFAAGKQNPALGKDIGLNRKSKQVDGKGKGH